MAAREWGLATLLLHPGNVLFVAPAVVASEVDIDRMVVILDDAPSDVEASRIAVRGPRSMSERAAGALPGRDEPALGLDLHGHPRRGLPMLR